MKNVQVKVSNNKMTIEIDLDADFGPSKSGKTIIIASTEGNQSISTPTGSIVLGLNLYRKKE